MKTKTEAARLAGERSIEPDSTEVCEFLEEWLATNPENVSLHGEPVVLTHVLKDINCDSDIEVDFINLLKYCNDFLIFFI